MFVVFLKFVKDKEQIAELVEGHRTWVKRGFDDSTFLLVGGLEPDLGGAILAHNTSLPELQNRVNEDPLVREKVVTAEIFEVAPSRADERLKFLLH